MTVSVLNTTLNLKRLQKINDQIIFINKNKKKINKNHSEMANKNIQILIKKKR